MRLVLVTVAFVSFACTSKQDLGTRTDASVAVDAGAVMDAAMDSGHASDATATAPDDNGTNGDGSLDRAGAPSPGYASCERDSDCPASAEGCFEVRGFDGTFDICTNRCDGTSDVVTCGDSGHCVSQSPIDVPARCYQRCEGDTDCPRGLRCRTGAESDRKFCAT